MNEITIDNSDIINDIDYLSEFRKKQSMLLKNRLNVFSKTVTNKHNMYNNINKGDFLPIESNEDTNLIIKLVELQNFVIIPIYCDDNKLSSIYTIGIWYYWGLPELIIKFKNPTDKIDIEFINLLLNILKNELYINNYKYISYNSPEYINRLDFDAQNIKIKKFDIVFNLEKMYDDIYITEKINYLLWFYSYYMDSKKNSDGEYEMYPLYCLELDEKKYNNIFEVITQKYIEFIEKDNSSDLDIDFNSTDSINSIDSIESININDAFADEYDNDNHQQKY